MTRVEIIPQTAQGISAMQGPDVIVRVTASDDTSGVSTDIPWTLQFSGAVYVRIVYRAGNLSLATSGQGPAHNRIYLPIVVKSRPQPQKVQRTSEVRCTFLSDFCDFDNLLSAYKQACKMEIRPLAPTRT